MVLHIEVGDESFFLKKAKRKKKYLQSFGEYFVPDHIIIDQY